jgi:hypothetical protein
MPTVFKIPTRLASFAAQVPVYKVMEEPFGKEPDWYNKVQIVREQLGLKDGYVEETKDFLIHSNGPLSLRLFKASNSFHFINKDLHLPSTEKELIPVEKAIEKAVNQLKQNQLVNDGAKGKLFQVRLEGTGHTTVQGTMVGKNKDNWEVNPEINAYKTELQVHFGFTIGQLPVFGPGAKALVAFVGNNISEQVYLWKTPIEPTDRYPYEIVAPLTAIERLSRNVNLINVEKINKKYGEHSNGRFHDDVELGYYATPAFNKQRFFIPVYKVRGTFESRHPVHGSKPVSIDKKQGIFRYDFTRFVSAIHGENLEFKLGDFARQVIFPPLGKIK